MRIGLGLGFGSRVAGGGAPDVTAPTIVSTSPADNATGVADTVSPTITFSENVAFGTGLITLRQNIASVWSDLETFDVVTEVGVGNGQVSISGAVVTINPTAALTAGREYAIRIAATAIDDLVGNSFAGIANDTTISFTTLSSADYIINNDTDWANTMALGAATLSGKTAEVRGALGAVSISNIAPASTFTIRGGSGGSVRRVAMANTTSKITFKDLPFQMTGWPHTEPEMARFDNGTYDNIKFDGCTFRHGYGPSQLNFDMTATYSEYTRVDNVRTATSSSVTTALTWQDAAATSGFIEFFNRGTNPVHVAVGGPGVTVAVGGGWDFDTGTGGVQPLAGGQRGRITGLNPTTDTHIAIITTTGTSQINARAEIGMSFYLADAFGASGAANIGTLEIRNSTFRDVCNAIKMDGNITTAIIVMDNDIDRVYQDNIARPPKPGGTGYIFRNLVSVPFSRQGIAEGLDGDARDPHGDLFQGFGDGTATMGPVYIAGNRCRRSARRANVNCQGVFFSDNDFTPSYNGLYIISEHLVGGSSNGISNGEALWPTGDVMVWGATVVDPMAIAAGASKVSINSVSEGRVFVGKTIAQSYEKNGAGYVRDDSILVSDAASAAALFPNSANIATAVTRAQVEAAWTTGAEGVGLGAVATANAIDWTTTDPTAVILWANVGSGVGWEDLTAQAINTMITLPLRRVLNKRTGQVVTPGAGVEWRSVATDGTTEVQAWTTSGGTIEPGQYIQIRRTSSASGLTALNYDITINGFLSRTSVMTAAAAPAVFHTQSGTGPYFKDPSNVPANTTRLEFKGNIYATGNPAGFVKIFTQESTGCDLQITSAGAIRLRVEDGSGATMLGDVVASENLTTGTWTEYALDVDMVAGTANVYRNGVNIGTWTFTATTGFEYFLTSREISFCAETGGASPMPSGWQVEFMECYFTTGGSRTLRKRVEGNAATVNADPWKLGTNAT